jgi:hypothetical protein
MPLIYFYRAQPQEGTFKLSTVSHKTGSTFRRAVISSKFGYLHLDI